MTRCAALILAGGSGNRLGSKVPKQYLSLNGISVLRRTVDTFMVHPSIETVQIVIGADDGGLYDDAMGDADIASPVVGGVSRQESSKNGLEALANSAPDYVLIHDAARPFVDGATIDRVLGALKTSPAVLPGLLVTDTLKRGVGKTPIVDHTVDRSGLWKAQTPQGFRFAEILEAHRSYEGVQMTDDAAIAEHAGLPVSLVQGHEDNFKITTAEDYRRAQYMTQDTHRDIRVGNGFDVHAFADGDHIVLCGIRIDHTHGLKGHSDADVAMHAVTDALLGAIAEGDIGSHFPPTEGKWRRAASSIFLEHAVRLISERGGSIGNIDLTIVCEAPQIGPHRAAMASSLAETLKIEPDRISVKATTTEKLGFTGRGEGIAAQATAIVRLG
ncbi:MAG: bifunctional 2-C-methyl-D-erythritol 4-phosphate cytidylyltransferase/2-C-methyl-D-erythritol 2,4-cyclodiphosphate synthase [Pseudomonadota bacterium]|nr:bifunctional 2-C-methyl-D-erythritol 4-phosphate cytidylyltransferase/2-C-methyl-D-erythritol 2,4-cyclodiphosphate synthase [Pseudomonadota bacterium]